MWLNMHLKDGLKGEKTIAMLPILAIVWYI